MSCCTMKWEEVVYMEFSKWRKLIKDVRWSGLVWVGECFFWYRPTRVLLDKRPLNSCVCVCVTYQLPFLSPNQQCQITKENTKNWTQPGKITHHLKPSFIHQQTCMGRNFIRPLCCLCNPNAETIKVHANEKYSCYNNKQLETNKKKK